MPTPAFLARRRAFLLGLLLSALALAAYWPALRGGFILDDDVFLTANPLIKAADGLRRFWFTGQSVDYWPLTSSSLWLEWRLWGLNPIGYHATNLALHVAAALLLWRILLRLGVPGAYLAALIFAVHPINVESVAWITQRKNTLAMVFFLLSILAYTIAEASASAHRPARPAIWRCASLAAFILALLSKASVAPLPLILLGLIAWRRRPTPRDVTRLIPFFAAAALLAAINLWFQHHGNAEPTRSASLLERVLGASAVPWFYLGKMLWPAQLIFVYPLWHINAEQWIWWAALVGTLGVSALLFGYRRRPAVRPWSYGWAYFCAMLLPVAGLTDIRFMRFSLVADHYAHLALIGVVVPISAALATRPVIGIGRTITRLAAAVIVAILAILTWRQCRLYRDAKTLYTASLAANPSSWLLNNNLGFVLQHQGLLPQALACYETAIRLKPDYPEAQNNLATALAALGRTDEAIQHCELALRLRPNFAEADDDLGVLRAHQGRSAEAIALFERAIALQPDFAMAHYNLAGALMGSNHRAEALGQLEQSVQLDPDFAEGRNSLGGLLFALGRTAEAEAQVRSAIRLQPSMADAHTNLAIILQSTGRAAAAREEFALARRSKIER